MAMGGAGVRFAGAKKYNVTFFTLAIADVAMV